VRNANIQVVILVIRSTSRWN